MADFTVLKTSIQQYIAQNGNKEITGNLLQTILLAMVQSMGDQAINGLQQLLSNEMIARENADGFLGQALTAEQQRAIAAETKSAELDGETKTLVFKNAAGQDLYQVSVESLVSNGLVDVEVDGTNLVMTFHTESGDEEITIPIGDIFNPSNYYTKTQVDNLLSPITTAITNVSSRLNEGYIYLGVADPETIPTSVTGKFFYIATQAGTYHFTANGDIPIVISSNGLYILSGGIEANDWFLETIVTFTSNVQFNNTQPVTSGGVFNAINPINELLHRNYMLAGVAYTTTIPSEDTNVFYLAEQGGTYIHFLNGDDEPLVLSKGLTVIYRGIEDDGWYYWVVYADNDFINTNRAQALTSDQQTEAQNNMVGKSYAPAQFSGLGKKVFAQNIQQVGGVSKNVMTQAFFQDEQGNALTNTVFVIQYDYTLGENVTIPAGCTLQFDGGSISGSYTIALNNTTIVADKAVFDCRLSGSISNDTLYISWLITANTQNIQDILDMSENKSVIFENKEYTVAKNLELDKGFILYDSDTLASDDDQPCLRITKDNVSIIGNGATLKVNTHAQGILEVMGAENVQISDLNLVGYLQEVPLDGTTGRGEKGAPGDKYYTTNIWGAQKNNSYNTSNKHQYDNNSNPTWGTFGGGYIGNAGIGLLIYRQSKNVVVSNINVSHFNYSGIQVGFWKDLDGIIVGKIEDGTTRSYNITIKNCVCHDSYNFGVSVSDCDGFRIENVDIYNIGHKDSELTDTYHDPGYGISCTRHTYNGIVNGNTIHDCVRYGIDSHGGIKGTVISGNKISDCVICGIYNLGNATYPVTDVTIENNYIERCSKKVYLPQFTICVGDDGSDLTTALLNIIVRNNIIKNCTGNGDKGSPIGVYYGHGIYIYNNLIDNSEISGSDIPEMPAFTAWFGMDSASTDAERLSDVVFRDNTIITPYPNWGIGITKTKDLLISGNKIVNTDSVNGAFAAVINNSTATVDFINNNIQLAKARADLAIELTNSDGKCYGNIVNTGVCHPETAISPNIEAVAGSSRPANPYVGQQFFDSTLMKPIWYKGSNVWVDATGATV